MDLCIYEDVNSSFACIGMDIRTLTDDMELTEQQQKCVDRIRSAITSGMLASTKLRTTTRAIAVNITNK